MSNVRGANATDNQNTHAAVITMGMAFFLVCAAVGLFTYIAISIIEVAPLGVGTTPELASFVPFPWLVGGCAVMTAALITSVVSIGYAKTSSVVSGFVVILVGWILCLLGSLAIYYLYAERITELTEFGLI